jgi:trigger factor
MKNPLSIQRKNLDRSRVQLVVPVSYAVYKPAFQRELETIAKDIKVEGFRPGKAPLKQVLAQIGKQRVEAGALDRAINTAYVQALEAEKILPVANPDITLDSYTAPSDDATDDTVVASFTAEMDVLPDVNVSHYQKIKVKAPKPTEVVDKDIEEVITYLRKQQASLKELAEDVKASKGMWADIGFKGTVDGVAREEMQSDHHPLVLGEGQLIPGFEDEIYGMIKGEKKTFKITFPKDYHAAGLAGKEAEFTVTLHELRDVTLPVIDQAFAKKFGHDTVEKLETAIKENLVLKREQENKLKLEELVMEELLKGMKFEVPASLVAGEEMRLREQAGKQLGGVPLSEQLVQQLQEQAVKNVRIGIALGKVVELEKIEERENASRTALNRLVAIATR